MPAISLADRIGGDPDTCISSPNAITRSVWECADRGTNSRCGPGNGPCRARLRTDLDSATETIGGFVYPNTLVNRERFVSRNLCRQPRRGGGCDSQSLGIVTARIARSHISGTLNNIRNGRRLLVPLRLAILSTIRPAGAQAGAGRGRQVFSSTGDIIRVAAGTSPGVRAGRFEVRRLLNWALSATAMISRGLFAVFFSSDCRLCDAPLVNISRLPVCQTCILSMHPISGETCDLCGERLPQLQRLSDIQTCSACQETRPSFGRATAYGAYQDELRELIHLLKY